MPAWANSETIKPKTMNNLSSRYPFLYFQFPAIAAAIAIFLASSFPTIPVPKLNIRFEDKWHHLVVYAIFAFLIARAFFYQSREHRLKKHYFIATILVGSLYGLSDEYHQSFVPGRFSDGMDVIADVLGVCIGTAFFRWRVSKEADI